MNPAGDVEFKVRAQPGLLLLLMPSLVVQVSPPVELPWIKMARASARKRDHREEQLRARDAIAHSLPPFGLSGALMASPPRSTLTSSLVESASRSGLLRTAPIHS